MILIISSIDDQSTNDVIDWLKYLNKKILRISAENAFIYQTINLTDEIEISFKAKNKQYKFSDFTKIWYRRSWLTPNFSANLLFSKDTISKQINTHLYSELKIANNFFLSSFNNKTLNKVEDNSINKLEVIRLAREVGLKTPNTILTTEKTELIKFNKKFKNIITKNISGGLFIFYKQYALSGFTERVTDDMIKDLPNQFHLTLFQEMVNKKFELRIFYLKGEFYASAIFSQEDNQTKVDFRNYNYLKPNRTPPFNLPKIISGKLNVLMNQLKLDSGSIDIIVNHNNDFIFLEVNPIGQFAQVSNPYNYYLEKKIAQELII